MKTLIIALALLMPSIVWAKCSSDQTTIINRDSNGVATVSKQSQVECRDGQKNIFSDCRLEQWQHPWGIGSSVLCNWNERQAMIAALTYSSNGDKIEWYDEQGNRGYVVVAWTRPMSNAGVCRDIEMVKYYRGSQDKNNYIMCAEPDGQWKSFKGF